jgi:maltose phosphorylase
LGRKILEPLDVKSGNEAFLILKLLKRILKTAFMHNTFLNNGEKNGNSPSNIENDKIQFSYDVIVAQGQNHQFKKIVWLHGFFKP